MRTFAVKHLDKHIVDQSRSGGIFTAISDFFLKNDGVIYGCVLDENLRAIHVRAIDENTRNRMRGSKYVQSDMRDVFPQVKLDLDSGKPVLFTGTSCQIAGLKGFLQKKYENLLCIDIVCHGVPSPLIWGNYLKWQGNVQEVDFRNKQKYGWRDHVETLVTDKKSIDSRVWTNIFYSHNALRPSCYECPFKSIYHPGDITIADYWGIEKAAPEFDDNKGVSLVMVNSEKGELWFDKTKEYTIWKETRIEDSMQPPLIAPFPKPKTREQFWEDFYNREFSYIAKTYGGELTRVMKVAQKIKNLSRKHWVDKTDRQKKLKFSLIFVKII